ncbi:MAG: hypothetical protein M5U34_36490 [Chloroflexi bacterium]|nr:hypothetical protein [Chloroflexota bacterium]
MWSRSRKFSRWQNRPPRANKFKSQFIARISHELRTPLGAVLGMAEMLQENIYGPLNSQQQDITQRIINNAHVLKQVFTELLDQSQIESGKLKLRNESFSPRQIVEDIHSNYLPIALQKGLTVQLEMNPNLPSVAQGDPVRVQQVISNLVMNAIKYTETGGGRYSQSTRQQHRMVCSGQRYGHWHFRQKSSVYF